MKFAVSIGMLGYTRVNALTCYNSDTKSFDDLTPAEARKEIDAGIIKGIKWRKGEDGPAFYCDTDGFNQQDIMVKSANKFRPYVNDVVDKPVNSMYTVARVLDTDYRGRLYEIVSNKYQRVKLNSEQLRGLNDLINVAGVWITEDEIKLADGLVYEDRRAEKSDEPPAEVVEADFSNVTTMQELFGTDPGEPVQTESEAPTESEEPTEPTEEETTPAPEIETKTVSKQKTKRKSK